MAGDLLPSRVQRLEELGMIWSAHEAAWQAGLAAARAWATGNGGHLAAPADAVIDGYPVGRWLVEQRSAAGRDETTGGLTNSRRKALAHLDPWWNPPWPLPWQRSYRIALAHLRGGGTLLDLAPGHLIAGHDIGTWARTQQAQLPRQQPEQRTLLARLGITTHSTPPTAVKPAATSQADRFTTGLHACQAWHAHHDTIANIKRKDTITLPDGTIFNIGIWISNTRQRATHLTHQQHTDLDTLGMRW
jgi:hypothetical protein